MSFLKRWLLGKRFGYITPGEMFSDYYRSDAMRMLTVVVALVFSVPYLGIQLTASGLLFNRLLAGTPIEHMAIASVEGGAIMLSIVVFIYVASGGLRSVAYVDCAQCILLPLGIIAPGFITLDLVGGWQAFKSGLASLAQQKPDMVAIPTRPESDSFLERAGTLFRQRWRPVDQPNDSDLYVRPNGYSVSPGLFYVGLCQPRSRSLSWQQVFASSLIIGGIMFFFTAA